MSTIANHPGSFPLYSSQTENDGVIMGYIDTFMFEGDFLTWTIWSIRGHRISSEREV